MGIPNVKAKKLSDSMASVFVIKLTLGSYSSVVEQRSRLAVISAAQPG